MSWKQNGDEDGDEGDRPEGADEEDTEDDLIFGDDRIFFVLDARQQMLEKNDYGESHLVDSLRVALAVMKAKIVSQEKCYLGITFFGSEKKDVGTSQNILQYFPLEPPSAARIRQLQDLIDDFDRKFYSEIGCMDESVQSYCPLSEALGCCSASFDMKSKAIKINSFKRIWLFTNDDNPNSKKQVDQNLSIQIGRDCADTNIEISLWIMSRVGRPAFDPSKFYNKLLIVDVDGALDDHLTDAGTIGFGATRTSMNIRRKIVKKRAITTGLMSMGPVIGEELAIGIQVFKLYNIPKRPDFVTLHSGTNEPITKQSFYIDAADGNAVDDCSIITCVDVGGRYVEYNAQEKNVCIRSSSGGLNDFSISSIDRASNIETLPTSKSFQDHITLRLHIFAPVVSLPVEYSFDMSMFVTPFEGTFKGSIAPFAALLKYMVQKQLLAVGSYTKSIHSIPRPCVFLPQEEIVDDFGTQIVPPGFNIVMLPFRSEVRYSSSSVRPEFHTASLDSQILAMADNLVNSLAFPSNAESDYTPFYTTIENPYLQHFYSVLQAIALSESEPTCWDREKDQMTRFFQLSFVAGTNGSDSLSNIAAAGAAFASTISLPPDAVTTKNKKRPTAHDDQVGSDKKSKTEMVEVDALLSEQWKLKFSQGGDGFKMSNDALKTICKALNLAVSGKKDLLVGRIVEKLQSL